MSRDSDTPSRPTNYRPPETAVELLRRYADGIRYFVDMEIPEGESLTNCNLEDANFENAILTSVDFSGANLRRVNFQYANLKCSSFRGADLRGVVFHGALVEATEFENANSEVTSFKSACYYGIELKDGDIP